MKRKIKFEAYRLIAIQGTQKEVEFDFLNLIKKADGLSIKERTYEYYEEKATLKEIHFYRSVWCLNFTKLRDTNIPEKINLREEEKNEAIILEDDEYIGENALVIYDPTDNLGAPILILQRNIHSLSPTGISMYLNNLWSNDDNIIFELAPVIDEDFRLGFKKRQEFKKIDIKLGNMLDKQMLGQSDLPLKKIFDGLQSFEGVNAQIVISVGNSKNKLLNLQQMKSLFNIVDQNKELVRSGKVTYVGDDDKTETADLFDNKIQGWIEIELEKKTSISIKEVEEKAIAMYVSFMRSTINKVIRNDIDEEKRKYSS